MKACERPEASSDVRAIQSASGSAADLRERLQSADAQLEQRVLARLLLQRAHEMRVQWFSRAKRPAQIHLVVAKQTRPEASIRGEPDTIARCAIGVRHRRDDTDASGRAGETVIGRGSIAPGGAGRGLQGA